MNAIQFFNFGHVYNNFHVILAPKILTLYFFLLYIAENKSAIDTYNLILFS